jgi:Zn ribbon nucleic-acid-binding protein
MIKTEIPTEYSEFSDVLIWNESTNDILIRNKDEDITLKLDGFTRNKYNELTNHINNSNFQMYKFKLMSAISNCGSVTQLGQYDESKIEGVNNRFKYKCSSCKKDTKFQVKAKYRSSHAECIQCGEHASIIKQHCSECKSERIFVKLLSEEIYTCNTCLEEIDW